MENGCLGVRGSRKAVYGLTIIILGMYAYMVTYVCRSVLELLKSSFSYKGAKCGMHALGWVYARCGPTHTCVRAHTHCM